MPRLKRFPRLSPPARRGSLPGAPSSARAAGRAPRRSSVSRALGVVVAVPCSLAPLTGAAREEPAGESAPPRPAPAAEPAPADPSPLPPRGAPEPPPPPEGFDAKTPLSAADLARKREGSYFTGLPLLNFDPNTGVGLGARAYYYDNGPRDSPLFAYTPYVQRLYLQIFATTGGLQYHVIDYDAPALSGTPYRVRAQLVLEHNTSQNFFGTGEATLDPLTHTGADRSFEQYSDYFDSLERVRADGTALSRYDQYDLRRYQLSMSLERSFLRGLVRPLVGFTFMHDSVQDHEGSNASAIDDEGREVEVKQGPTRLTERCDAGQLIGCSGGWDNMLRLGISLDTRDFEPDPNSGIFFDTALDLASKVLGSSFDYARFLVSLRGYVSPVPSFADLVVAARGTFEVQSSGVPFFSLNRMPYVESSRAGLGGLRTLRGFRQDRFVGPVLAMVNLELRWTLLHFSVAGQDFAPLLVPFLDVGRPFDSVGDLSLDRWKLGHGAALRIAWNQATIITAEYGVSREDAGLYVNFEHQF